MEAPKRITVVPNYGRDYKSKAAVLEAWAEGKDFKITDMFSGEDGRAVNKEDADRQGVIIMARYDRLTKVVEIKPTKAK